MRLNCRMQLLPILFATIGSAVISLSAARATVGGERDGVAAVLPISPDETQVVCDGVDGDIRFEILLRLTETGRARALAMRLSDPSVALGRSEIALFQASERTLIFRESVITGRIDPMNPKTNRAGERVGGTRLGELSTLSLDLRWPLAEVAQRQSGRRFGGQALYVKKNGDELVQDLDCARHK